MAKKKEGPSFQLEIRNDTQWHQLMRKDGLIIVDVYPGWTGPCMAMVNILKRVKTEIAEKHDPNLSNKLTFAIACSDKIEDLLMFKDRSEPTWLFLTGGGKPVRVLKGGNVPQLVQAINQEFETELLVMEGKQRRIVISIDDDETRMKKFEAEAQRLADMLKDEEEPMPEEENPARRGSSVMLETIMSAFTIAVIQPFLLSQIKQIKEFLSGEFTVLGEASIKIDDEAARRLYRIPYEVEETQEESRKSADIDPTAEDTTGDNRPASSPKKKVPVILPPGVIGDTTFILLESTEIKKILESGNKPTGALQTADDWLRLKVGPRNYEQAVEHSPGSLHAQYGKGEYMSGVWCPRRYDDKRHILLTYFPQFLVEKVLPYEVGEEYVPKRYCLFVFPITKSKEITETIKSNEQDVFASGKFTISGPKADKMVKSWNLSEEEAPIRKQQLTAEKMMCVSINRRNEALMQKLQGMMPGPLHYSVNPVTGARETASMFPNLNAKYEEDAEEVLQKYQARAKERVQSRDGEKKLKNEKVADQSPTQTGAASEAEGEKMDSSGESAAPMSAKSKAPSNAKPAGKSGAPSVAQPGTSSAAQPGGKAGAPSAAQPAAKLGAPSAAQSAAKSGAPVAQPATKSGAPAAQSAAKSGAPAAQSAAKSGAPAAQSAAKSGAPAAQSAAKSGAPAAQSAAKSGAPAAQSAAKSGAPATQSAAKSGTPAAQPAAKSGAPAAQSAPKSGAPAAQPAAKSGAPAAQSAAKSTPKK